MLRASFFVAGKDLRLIILGGSGLIQSMLLGLLLILVFSLAEGTAEKTSPRAAATIFWLASAFCLVLAGNMVHALENTGGCRTNLLLAPISIQSIWLGKALAILTILILAQCFFLPGVIAFLQQHLFNLSIATFAQLLAIDIGLACLASLLGAMAQGGTARESLICVLLFPLIVPVLLAGINFGETILNYTSISNESEAWSGVILAFDAIFIAASIVLFPIIYTDED